MRGYVSLVVLIALLGGLALASVAGALVFANLVAAIPERVAARTPAALILRAE